MKDKIKVPYFVEDPEIVQLIRSRDTDAGFDIKARVPIDLKPYKIEGISVGNVHYAIHTGLHVSIPKGYVGLIWPRSGLALRYGADTLAGVVDSGYTGEVMVIMTTDEDIHFEAGDRIAQLLIQEVPDVELVYMDSMEELEATKASNRGANGFGSTGV